MLVVQMRNIWTAPVLAMANIMREMRNCTLFEKKSIGTIMTDVSMHLTNVSPQSDLVIELELSDVIV
jgi:hypothetical protein